MEFNAVPNLGNVHGVFKGIYVMYGPYYTAKDAKEFAKRTGAKRAVYVESNKMLYILRKEVKDVVTEKVNTEDVKPIERKLSPTYPYPKPEPEKAKRKWV